MRVKNEREKPRSWQSDGANGSFGFGEGSRLEGSVTVGTRGGPALSRDWRLDLIAVSLSLVASGKRP